MHDNIEPLRKYQNPSTHQSDSPPCICNRFPTDTDKEIDLIIKKCKELGVNVVLSTVWADGGNGGIELAKEVVRLCDTPNDFTYSYADDLSIEEKIRAVVFMIV